MTKVGKIIRPKKQEKVPEWKPRPHLVPLEYAPHHKTFEKASEALAKIPGGFQRMVVARSESEFVPVVMLMPTEFTPDIIGGCQRNGCHVMVGQATGIPIYDSPREKKAAPTREKFTPRPVRDTPCPQCGKYDCDQEGVGHYRG